MATGEVVFNTVLTGYQEVITDPSYAGQIITFTYPHIGNYGVTPDDDESRRPFCRGVIVRDLARRPSSWRSAESLEAFLVRHRLPGLTGIDTRRLTRHLRDAGSMPAAFGPLASPAADGASTRPPSRRPPSAEPGTDGRRPGRRGHHHRALHGRRRPAAGRRLRLRHQAHHPPPPGGIGHRRGGAGVDARPTRCWPASPTACSSPTARATPPRCRARLDAIAGLLGEVPVFGICLGHQLLATALGGRTYKLPFGHHGGNHPVRRLATGAVEITSQNHNYAVAAGSRRRRPTSPTSTSTTASSRASAAATRPPSACSTTPRPDPAPTTPATSSTSSAG